MKQDGVFWIGVVIAIVLSLAIAIGILFKILFVPDDLNLGRRKMINRIKNSGGRNWIGGIGLAVLGLRI